MKKVLFALVSGSISLFAFGSCLTNAAEFGALVSGLQTTSDLLGQIIGKLTV